MSALPSSDANPVWVICLCADWCGVCRDYRSVFADLMKQHSSVQHGFQFAWVDVEDHAELAGELDIDTFPTLLMADDAGVLFFGPLTSQPATLTRLLVSLQDPAAPRTPHFPESRQLVDALPAQPQLHVTV
ncbi:MAG: thioredoxin family protein [Pseudomonadota bacterium]